MRWNAFKEWLRNESKVLDVVLEKVAESDELTNLTQIGRRWHVTEQLKFLTSRPNAFRSEDKSKIGHSSVAKETFGLVFLEFG